MKKTLITIMIGIFLISFASATTIYSGGCLPVNLSEMESLDNVTYDVIGNSSNLKGLTIELNEKIAEVCTVVNYKPDNFTLIFIDSSTKEVIKEVYYSGGSSGGSSSSSSSSGSSRINQDTLTKGYTRYLYKNQKIFFTFKETHYVQFLGFEKDLAKIRIQSEPIYIYLKVGDTEMVDLDNETIYITLLSKDERGVNLFIQNRVLPPLVGESCGTVSPDYRNECCQNKGFDKWSGIECIMDDLITSGIEKPTDKDTTKEPADDDIIIGIDDKDDLSALQIILGVILIIGIGVIIYFMARPKNKEEFVTIT